MKKIINFFFWFRLADVIGLTIGSLQPFSVRAQGTAFTYQGRLNARLVLAKVAALPINEWSYKSQDSSIRHLGRMAQDFKAAFGVGESDTGITTIDADGVGLAAIQNLNQKFETENADLRSEIKELRALVEAMNRKLNGGDK